MKTMSVATSSRTVTIVFKGGRHWPLPLTPSEEARLRTAVDAADSAGPEGHVGQDAYKGRFEVRLAAVERIDP